MRVMDEAVDDRVGDGRLANDLVPGRDGELRGDEGRAIAPAILEDLQEIPALLIGQRR